MKDNILHFLKLFHVPEFVMPHLSGFVSGEEMDLVVAFNGERLTVAEAASRMGICAEKAAEILEGAYLKSVLNKKTEDGTTYYLAADFYELLDYRCKFDDKYLELPKDIRDKLDQWCYDEYKARMIPVLERIRNGEPEEERETFLLLEDMDEFLNLTQDFRVVPCNCRRLKQGCGQPTETCLRFGSSIDDRTFGIPISREEAKEIITSADKSGLMHTVNRNWRETGPKYMCNCCTTCCYPFRLVEDLGLKGLWPQIRYVARYDKETCNYCGKCTKRCPFEAFFHNGSEIEYKGKVRKDVSYDREKCFGCGLCANTCPTESIKMHKV